MPGASVRLGGPHLSPGIAPASTASLSRPSARRAFCLHPLAHFA